MRDAAFGSGMRHKYRKLKKTFRLVATSRPAST